MCPNCSKIMKKLVLKGVECDRCNFCGGIWLDFGEYEELKKSEDMWIDVLDGKKIETSIQREPRICPRCKILMHKELLYDKIAVDVCRECNGAFYDSGEVMERSENEDPSGEQF